MAWKNKRAYRRNHGLIKMAEETGIKVVRLTLTEHFGKLYSKRARDRRFAVFFPSGQQISLLDAGELVVLLRGILFGYALAQGKI